MRKFTLTKHLTFISILTILLTLAIIYPFMPGEYDRLAVPLSILIQIFGTISMLLSILGIIWLFIPKQHKLFTRISLNLGLFLVIILAFLAYLTSGILLGIAIIVLGILSFIQIRKSINKTSGKDDFSFITIYLISLPIFILTIQLLLGKPITNWSRDRSITNANEYIRDIEIFKRRYGYYPKTLQAMYKDYFPQTAGVEKYYYLPFGDSYNISFEQPRFFFDVIGTKEWVVYNPKDEHKVYSHTSWFLLLSPEELENSQGWYASENTKHNHWKSFLFD